MNKEYGYKELLLTYIEAQRRRAPWVSEELRNYYPRLLGHLEKAFGLTLSSEALEDFNKQIIFSLFRNTAESYRDLRHPWSNYQVATLLIRRLEEAGPSGERILRVSDEIREKTQENADLHLKMLYELFECIYDPTDTIVTSEQLLAMGFDDSKEPTRWEFED